MGTAETIGGRIRRLRRAARLSHDAVAGRVGRSRSWIIRAEGDGAQVKAADLAKLATVLGVAEEYLLRGEEGRGQEGGDDLAGLVRRAVREELRASSALANARPAGTIGAGSALPVVDAVDAGAATDHGHQEERYIAIGPELFGIARGAVFVVVGECLRDRLIMPGDYLVVDEDNTEPRDGEIAVARVNGVYTAKVFYRVGDAVELRPASPGFDTIVVRPEDELEIVGVYVGVVRAPKRRR